MRLYFVLLPIFFLGWSNMQSWQNNQNMTKAEIKAQLVQKRQLLTTLLVENNLEATTVLSKAQQEVLSQIDGILGVTEAPQEIGKGAFIEYVQNWIEDYRIVLSNEDDEDIVLLVKDIRRSLRGQIQNPKFPISILIWDAFNKKLKELGDTTNPQALRDALREGLDVFSKTMNDKPKLSDHFKEVGNKGEYTPIKKEDLDKQIMSAQAFEIWLAQTSQQAQVQQNEHTEKRKQEEKEQRQEIDAFREAYAMWLAKQKEVLSKAISTDRGTDSTNTMSKAKFIAILMNQSRDWRTAQPELSDELTERVLSYLESDSLEVKDYVSALLMSITGIATPEETIAKNWLKTRRLPIMSGIVAGLTTGNEGYSDYDIVEEYIEWFGQVGNVVDSLKLSNRRQFVAEKLVSNLEATLKTPELALFLPALKQHIQAHNKPFLSLQETNEAWKMSIASLITASSTIIDNYNKIKGIGTRPDSLNDLLEAQAGVDTLQQMFKNSLRPLPKPVDLSKGEAVNLVLHLNDGTVLTSRLWTTIERVGKIPYARPAQVELNVANGESPYQFTAKPVFDQSPVVRSEEMVTVDFEYTIVFDKDRGTSEAGGGSSIDANVAVSQGQYIEKGETQGVEHTRSEGKNTTKGSSNTHGVSAEGKVSFLGLFKAEVATNHEMTFERSTEWTSEKSETTSTSQSTTVGTSKEITTAIGNSKSETWNSAVHQGRAGSYFTIKATLTASEINSETMQLSVETIRITTPDSKGLVITLEKNDTNKTVRWKK